MESHECGEYIEHTTKEEAQKGELKALNKDVIIKYRLQFRPPSERCTLVLNSLSAPSASTAHLFILK